jgi:hypothetical protein
VACVLFSLSIAATDPTAVCCLLSVVCLSFCPCRYFWNTLTDETTALAAPHPSLQLAEAAGCVEGPRGRDAASRDTASRKHSRTSLQKQQPVETQPAETQPADPWQAVVDQASGQR